MQRLAVTRFERSFSRWYLYIIVTNIFHCRVQFRLFCLACLQICFESRRKAQMQALVMFSFEAASPLSNTSLQTQLQISGPSFEIDPVQPALLLTKADRALLNIIIAGLIASIQFQLIQFHLRVVFAVLKSKILKRTSSCRLKEISVTSGRLDALFQYFLVYGHSWQLPWLTDGFKEQCVNSCVFYELPPCGREYYYIQR
ncbi:Hypothetical_protein [Hexamita inflata]|uniref:Hypothetical_protein n=1 Tax=Hexamita inflata TaxID=28002 RepID=A0AA86PA11_9EUKA|nr:Hypothetical protein HINF_LOCUS21413 [Hexamita inflata]CAI9933785.1 Hypothetical protein HINF_LOCUS21430 [Hexamita inflata]CAI9933799.1 Hypothetical protein HINF_LOCUS21444 [Hexamita inflata]CAI9933805.1 Hypothetical protein HINF_LOCUS21450 [Hexamita inflata]CAI9933811.1 Hypothetical protein HINF_LOCUS21456 [Hexamita inflata]